MQIAKDKIAAIAIALILTLSLTASMMLIPNASAHTPAWSIPTYAYIAVAPNPVGVGQQLSIFIWLANVYDQAAVTNDYRFRNYQLTITAPDNTSSTKTFAYISDSTSNQLTFYTPTQVGTYTFTFNFPGQAINAYDHATMASSFFGPPSPDQFVNDTYLPSSASTTVTVQQAQLPAPIGSSPLPTQYWTRPIYGENNIWYTISSNWLGTGAPGYGSGTGPGEAFYHPDAVGPLTSHIMWTKPLQSGGVVGGNSFIIAGNTYMEGSAYLQRYVNPIILDGMLYYTEPVGETGTSSGPTDCVNLQTGQLIWSKTSVPALSFGYIYDMETPDYHGVWPPILIANTGGFNFATFTFTNAWSGYDGDTGNWLFNVTNMPSGTSVMGSEGEVLQYILANDGTFAKPAYYLAEWNSSDMGTWGTMATGVLSGIVNGGLSTCYDWNVSVSALNTMTSPTILDAHYGDMLLCMSGTLPSNGGGLGGVPSSTPYTYFAINLNSSRGAVGSILWTNTLQPPADNLTVISGGADFSSGVFLESLRETMQWVGYSLATGQKIWGPTTSQQQLDYYGSTGSGDLSGQLANGKLYSSGYGGILYCYDDTTGNLLWTYGNGGAGNSTNAGFQNAYGDYPTFVNAIGNGVVYTITTAHTVETPIYKGALARAINATTGQEIWTLSSYTTEFSGTSFAIADGFATWFNGYDNQIYVVGRGPSATTVTAPGAGLSFGEPVVISGSVTDVSAGTKQTEQAADFPNGVPCASDSIMGDWMSYVYQQQPIPTNFTGVPVTLSVLDSNGNCRQIGTATTDVSGTFGFTWTPDIPGSYTVYANFAGTNGYWPSSAEAHFTVTSQAATAAPTATTQSNAATPTDLAMYLAIGVIAIIIAIAIVGALMLRKRP